MYNSNSMADSYSELVKMLPLRIFLLIVLTTWLNAFNKISGLVEARSQAFIQTDNELRYLIDGVSIHLHEGLTEEISSVSFTDVDEDTLHTYSSPIRFDPSLLDFHEHPVGMPAMEKVVVLNPSEDTSIHLDSISGSTVDFHCSFFQEKSIPPLGNTTFDVVFLGRQEGSVENILFIHTSLGSFKYHVKAVGMPNPYRVKPFLGVKMPLNSSYSPLIELHNPFSSTLHVTEMYSSGGDLHLELPSGHPDAPRLQWEIPPYETRPLMRANFVARTESNHTAYIRIKTNSSSNLILPIEIEVSSAPGIYSPSEILDFGLVRTNDGIKTLMLNLINYGQKHIHVQTVIATPVNDAVSVDFRPVRVPPDTLHSTQVAAVSFNPAKAVHTKKHSGKIVVKSKNNQFKLTIPYQVTMLHGSLLHNVNITTFYIGSKPIDDNSTVRSVTITNTFNVSLIVHSVALSEDARPFFTIRKFQSIVLAPGQTATILELKLDSGRAISITSFLRIFTNISFFDIPIVIYDGRLKKYALPTLNTEQIEFGTLGMGERREVYFVLINENPVQIRLKSWGSNMTKSVVELMGVEEGNITNVVRRQNISGMAKSLILRPKHFAIFRVGVTAPETRGLYYGEVFVETKYERTSIPFSLWSVKGSLNADPVIFDGAFPEKISWKQLHIHSTFAQPMTVTSVEPLPKDSRFTFEPIRSSALSGPILHPESKSHIGKLSLDPTKECLSFCYTGLATNTGIGQQWLYRLSLPMDVGDVDSSLYNIYNGRWNELVLTGRNSMNLTFQLHTNEVKGFLLRAQVNFQWPHLTAKSKIKFPLTQIGNTTVREFLLENPSAQPVVAQLIIMSSYPSYQSVMDALHITLADQTSDALEMDDSKVFRVLDLEHNCQSEDSPNAQFFNGLEEQFGIKPHPSSLTLLLAPGMRYRFHVGFTPKDEVIRSSVILIRNNLTILDSVMLQGQGGYGQLKFGNKKPGTTTPLLFEMTDKHLKDCSKMKNNKYVPPNFTVKRSFTARNPGELPVYIRGFGINGIRCGGYGFRVLNCQGFELQANSSRKIDIAFTPDFTMSKVERTLNILTSLSPRGVLLNYSLVVTIPPQLVTQCAAALPRPYWEPLLYYVAVAFMCILLICILLAAFLESDRIFRYRFIAMTTTTAAGASPAGEEVFDLRNLSRSVEQQLSSRKHPVENGGGDNMDNSKKRKDGNNVTVCNNVMNIPPQMLKNKKALASSQNGGLKHSLVRYSSRDRDAINNNNVVKDMENETSCSDFNVGGVNSSSSSSGGRRRSSKRNIYADSDQGMDSETANRNRQNKSWTSFLKSCMGGKKSFRGSGQSETNIKNEIVNNYSCAAPEDDAVCEYQDKSGKSGVCKSRRSRAKTDEHDRSSRKNSLVHEVLEEETSSTTTESSNTDVDLGEKCHKPWEQSQALKPARLRNAKTSKSRNPELDAAVVVTVKNIPDLEDDDEGEFEVSTKSKSHRKSKLDAKSVGGEYIRPTSLELPYKLKSINTTKEDKIIRENISTNNINGRLKKLSGLKLKGIQTQITEGDHNDSPTPEWDHPKPFTNNDEAFNELAKQTESFAQKRLTRQPFSYSSIVSDGCKARSAPIGKVVPETKKQEPKHPGTIGQRPNSQKSPPVLSVTPNIWGSPNLLSPATPQTPLDPSAPSFLCALPNPEQVQQSHPCSISCDSSYKIGSSKDGLENMDRCFNGFNSNPNDLYSLGRLWDSQPCPPIANCNKNRLWQQESRKLQQGAPWESFGLNSTSESWWEPFSRNANSWVPNETLGFPSSSSGLSGVSESMTSSPWPASVWLDPFDPDPANSSTKTALAMEPIAAPNIASRTSPLSSCIVGDDKTLEASDDMENAYRPGFDPFRTPHTILMPTARPSCIAPGCGSSSDANPNSISGNNHDNWDFSFFSNQDVPK